MPPEVAMAEFRIVVPKLNVETRARGEAAARPALDHIGVSAHEAAVARFKLKMADDGSPPCSAIHTGVIAVSGTGAPALGKFQPVVVLALYGETPNGVEWGSMDIVCVPGAEQGNERANEQ